MVLLGLLNTMETDEERISGLEFLSVETLKIGIQREQRVQTQNRILRDHYKRCNMHF